jgi:alpha-D-ribose 1-methylphosphonate 5-triphosphate synthase subunit PhnI
VSPPALQLSVGDIELIAEALRHRAARLEAYGRAYPHNAGPHERKAMAMRVLRDRLLRRSK